MHLGWIMSLLFVAALSLSTWLQPWFENWSGARSKSTDILTVALGDSRRLFAKHFYVKADAYFHSGYYPTIFDNQPGNGKLHMAGSQSGEKHEEEGPGFLGEPQDWIDRFSRHFYPSTHRHLGEGHEAHDGHGGVEHHEAGPEKSAGEERELLPWLKLSAQLDPQQPDTYVMAAYWLRSRLGNIDQAELFLRQGLQSNPGHYGILFELGRIYYENRKDPARARNVWELALKDWREKQAAHADPEFLVYDQLLGQLARLEEAQQAYSKALAYLEELKSISPSKAYVEKWIEDVKKKAQ